MLRTAAKLGVLVGEGADAISLRYVATPLDAMQLLLTRRADHALLGAEPAVSMGLLKSRSLPVSVIAPDLHRSNMQQEWGRACAGKPCMPQAGMVLVVGTRATRPRWRACASLCAAQQVQHTARCLRQSRGRASMLTP